jgi:hypothetical protein
VMSPAQVGEAPGLVEPTRSYMIRCAVRTRLPIAPGRATLCRHHPGSGSASRAGRVDSRRTTAGSTPGWLGVNEMDCPRWLPARIVNGEEEVNMIIEFNVSTSDAAKGGPIADKVKKAADEKLRKKR